MASGNKRPMLTAERRAGLQRRGLRLAYATLGWNVVRLRPSEVRGLHWPDLHLDESTRVDTLRISAGEPIKAAGVKWSPHAMRHTYATTLLERGVAIHVVAELLGGTVATVESNYSRVIRTKHEVADVIASLLG